MDCFPLEGFNHVTNIGVLIWDLFVWSGCSRCSVFWEYPMYPNMVSDRLWRAAFGFDQDLEPVLSKLWKGLWFWILCAFEASRRYSIVSRASFSLENSLRFIENCFNLFQKHPFRQIWRYNVTVTDLFYFFKISHILSVLLLDLYCFSFRLLPSLAVYALCCAPCAIAANQKQ